METVHTECYTRSIPLSSIINPSDLSIPEWHDEPYALVTKTLTQDQRIEYLQTSALIRELGGRYQRCSSSLTAFLSLNNSKGTIGYKRAISHAHPVPGSGEYKIFEPKIILPETELTELSPEEINTISKITWGTQNQDRIKKMFDTYEQKYYSLKIPTDLEKRILNTADYEEKLDCLFSIKNDSVYQFYTEMKKNAKELCTKSGYESLQLPILCILLTIDFFTNIPLNPPDHFFSVNNYNQRVKELRQMYQK